MSFISKFPVSGKAVLTLLLFCLSLAVPAANSVLVGDLIFEQSGGKPVVEDLLRFNVRLQPGKRFYLSGYAPAVYAH